MKQIDTLLEDINVVIQHPHKVNKNAMAEFMASVKDAVESMIGGGDKVGGKTFLRPSNYGKPCKRQLWYDINLTHANQKTDPRLQMVFLTGHIMEALMLLLAKQAGHSVQHQQEEFECLETGVKGHIDALIDGCLVDCKTSSEYSFRKYRNKSIFNGKDDFGYLPQLAWYKKRTGATCQYLWVMNKSNSEMELLPVPDEEMPDPDEMMREVQQAVSKDTPPPIPFTERDTGSNKEIPGECTYCKYKEMCFDNIRTFEYSSGLRHFTEINKQPKVKERK